MRILLIDDDIDDRQLFTEALEDVDAGVVCEEATGGEEALQKLFAETDKKPDLIFLDINLPVMSGWDFLKQLKQVEAFKHLPVIVYSTSSHQKDRETAESLGALCFVTKPDEYKQLKNMLNVVVSHAHQNSLSKIGQAIQNN